MVPLLFSSAAAVPGYLSSLLCKVAADGHRGKDQLLSAFAEEGGGLLSETTRGWFILPTASKGALGPSCVVSLLTPGWCVLPAALGQSPAPLAVLLQASSHALGDTALWKIEKGRSCDFLTVRFKRFWVKYVSAQVHGRNFPGFSSQVSQWLPEQRCWRFYIPASWLSTYGAAW